MFSLSCTPFLLKAYVFFFIDESFPRVEREMLVFLGLAKAPEELLK